MFHVMESQERSRQATAASSVANVSNFRAMPGARVSETAARNFPYCCCSFASASVLKNSS
jgi:hypothetical protein